MREIVFANPAKRKELEAITWPAIRAELTRRSAEAGGTYQIHAIPLFVEGGAKGGYDRVLLVDCSEALQMQRLMGRDGVTELQARQSLTAQATRAQRLAVATDIIVNNDSLDALRTQVTVLHQRYLELAAQKSAL
jgi:dephospho-CoA kinase